MISILVIMIFIGIMFSNDGNHYDGDVDDNNI